MSLSRSAAHPRYAPGHARGAILVCRRKLIKGLHPETLYPFAYTLDFIERSDARLRAATLSRHLEVKTPHAPK